MRQYEFSPRLSPPNWRIVGTKSGVKAQVPMAKQSHSEVFTLFGARAFHSLSHC